jgi:hypothetical protein
VLFETLPMMFPSSFDFMLMMTSFSSFSSLLVEFPLKNDLEVAGNGNDGSSVRNGDDDDDFKEEEEEEEASNTVSFFGAFLAESRLLLLGEEDCEEEDGGGGRGLKNDLAGI